ncbi:MAG: sugar ABC transporter ATP-binding protein, partial [Candidatus Nanopelagicales bacterium]
PPPHLLEARNVVKTFGATRAVRDVSLEVPAGSIFGLVGENGAGKSTLAKIFAGVHTPDSGEILISGQPVSFRNPYEGIRGGVSMMAQEIMLVPDATVEENVLLGNLPRRAIFPNRKAMRRRYDELVELTQFDLDPRLKVAALRIADQQKVEILRALSQDARLIIMDEPSAALTANEVVHLHASIRQIVERGATVILISHFLEEVLSLSNRVAIMRDGELVRVGDTVNETVDSLVAGMVGKSLATEYASVHRAPDTAIRLSVSHLQRPPTVNDVSFEIHAGEIVGLAGLIGSGRSEIARCIFGADRASAGEIHLDGQAITVSSPKQAIDQGIFMIPESRKEQGLVLGSSIADNLTLASLSKATTAGIVSGRRIKQTAKALAEKVDLRFTTIAQPAVSLSGGNQQKLLFGRAVDVTPTVLIVDEPTRGVDIAAKRGIHATLQEMADAGLAVLFISSEIDEVLGVCNRVLVVHRGRIQAEFRPPYVQEDVLAAFFGKDGKGNA